MLPEKGDDDSDQEFLLKYMKEFPDIDMCAPPQLALRAPLAMPLLH